MRHIVIILVLALCAPAWGQKKPCTTQDYSETSKPPDWRCPGPDEGILVPDIKSRPSLGVPAGSSLTLKGKKAKLVDFDTVLLDKNKVIELGMRIQGLRRLRWIERHEAEQLMGIERKYLESKVSAQLSLEQSRVKVAVQQRDQARKERDSARKWYKSWTFGLVVGIVTTTAAVISTAYVVK